MDLTPRDIQDKQFNDAFRGYSHEEVDLFLDQVADSFDRAFKENQTFHHRLKDLEEQLFQARATEDMLKKTLLAAQKTADEAIQEARSLAVATVEGAETAAREIVERAQLKGAEVLAAAEQQAHDLVADAEAKLKQIEERIAELRDFHTGYVTDLRSTLEGKLAGLRAETPREPAPARASLTPKPEQHSGASPFAGQAAAPTVQGAAPTVHQSAPSTAGESGPGAPANPAPAGHADAIAAPEVPGPTRQADPVPIAHAAPVPASAASVDPGRAVYPVAEDDAQTAPGVPASVAVPDPAAPAVHTDTAPTVPPPLREEAAPMPAQVPVQGAEPPQPSTAPRPISEDIIPVSAPGAKPLQPLGAQPASVSRSEKPAEPLGSPRPAEVTSSGWGIPDDAVPPKGPPKGPLWEKRSVKGESEEDERSVKELFWGEE